MKKPHSSPSHVLIRISAQPDTDSVHDVVAAHRAVIKARGYVWFGMWKLRIAADRLERLKHQCEENTPTYLYLVQRSSNGFNVYRGIVTEVSTALPSNSRESVPKYYLDRKMLSEMGSWLKLSDFQTATNAEFERLHVPTTDSVVPDLLKRSQVAFALVSASKN
jgi:hypothetical protein